MPIDEWLGPYRSTALGFPVDARHDITRKALVLMMEFTHLGRSGLSVSRLCLGTMNFGPLTSESDAHAIMDAAHEHGINFFDTANAYGLNSAGVSGLGEGKGSTEQIIGRWFAQGDGRREKTVLATKLYGDMGDWPNEGKLSALNIRRALDASLKRLQTDYIDLYQFHHIDRDTPWDEIWQAIDVAITAGKILYAGSSNFAGWHIAQAQAAAAQRNLTGLSSEQSLYNLITRDIELEVIPAAQHYGLGIIPWSPLKVGCSAACCARNATASDGSKDGPPRSSRPSASRSRPTRTSPPNSGTSPATSRWRGYFTSPPSPPRSSVHAPSSNSTTPSEPSRSNSTDRRWRDSTKSSLATRPLPNITRGDRSHHAVTAASPGRGPHAATGGPSRSSPSPSPSQPPLRDGRNVAITRL